MIDEQRIEAVLDQLMVAIVAHGPDLAKFSPNDMRQVASGIVAALDRVPHVTVPPRARGPEPCHACGTSTDEYQFCHAHSWRRS